MVLSQPNMSVQLSQYSDNYKQLPFNIKRLIASWRNELNALNPEPIISFRTDGVGPVNSRLGDGAEGCVIKLSHEGKDLAVKLYFKDVDQDGARTRALEAMHKAKHAAIDKTPAAIATSQQVLIQECVKGKRLSKLEDNEIDLITAKQICNLMDTIFRLSQNDIVIDIFPPSPLFKPPYMSDPYPNLLYDKDEGFNIVDIVVAQDSDHPGVRDRVDLLKSCKQNVIQFVRDIFKAVPAFESLEAKINKATNMFIEERS